MNKREPEMTPDMLKMSPKDVAGLLKVTEERARELLAQAGARTGRGRPGRKRRSPTQVRKDLGDKPIIFYGPL